MATTNGECRILLTSRKADWDHDLDVKMLPLNILPRKESIELLGTNGANILHTDGDAIANELGDLPLALYLAGKYLYKFRKSPLGEPATYLTSLRCLTPLQHSSLGDPKDRERVHAQNLLERTFALSYERLNAVDTIDQIALKIVARASYFAPEEPIPHHLLRATMEQMKNDEDEIIVLEAVQRLIALGLLDEQTNEMQGVYSYRMHRLLTLFVHQRSPSHNSEAQQNVEQILLEEASPINDAGYPAPLLVLQQHLRMVTTSALSREDVLAANLSEVQLNHFSGGLKHKK